MSHDFYGDQLSKTSQTSNFKLSDFYFELLLIIRLWVREENTCPRLLLLDIL